jgi:hypothetical protein
MNSFFDLPHVIIVFHPGSAGNWLADIFHQIITGKLEEVKISNVGSSHNLDVIPELSFGTHKLMESQFNNPAECFDYYFNFVQNYKKLERTVLVTHDFTNIPLYRQYYPNARIVVITLDSPAEKLIATFFQIEKTILDPNFRPIFSKKVWEKITGYWLKQFKNILWNKLGNESLVRDIISNRYHVSNRNIITYLAMQGMINRYNLVPLLNGINDQDTINYVHQYSSDQKTNVLSDIGDHYSKFIDNNCLLLPFNDLINSNLSELMHIIEKAIQKNLSIYEKDFVQDNLNKFIVSQNPNIVNDPFTFYNRIKIAAEKDLQKIKDFYKI